MELSIKYGISLGISIVNTVLVKIIRKATMLEAHHSLTEQLASTTGKLWIIQFINTCVLIILINADWTAF